MASPGLPHAPVPRAALEYLKEGVIESALVPSLAVGLGRERKEMLRLLMLAKQGPSAFKFVRAAPGAGGSFFSRVVEGDARTLGFLSTRLSVGQAAPLHDLLGLYRAVVRGLRTTTGRTDAIAIALKALSRQAARSREPLGVLESRHIPRPLAGALREFFKLDEKDRAARGEIYDWMCGGAEAPALIAAMHGCGPLVEQDAVPYLGGIAALARAAGYNGIAIVLDDVEEILDLSPPQRAAALDNIVQILEGTSSQRRLVWTFIAKPPFFDAPDGVPASTVLRERLRMTDELGFQSPRQHQMWLPAWDASRLRKLGRRLRDLYVFAPGIDGEAALSDREIARLAQRAEMRGRDAARVLCTSVLDALDKAESKAHKKRQGFDETAFPPVWTDGQAEDVVTASALSIKNIVGAINVNARSILSEVKAGTFTGAPLKKESSLGRYDILKPLGKGAGGIAFLGRDSSSGEELVLKVLNPALADDKVAVARFARECVLARRINHPGVCKVYGLEEAEGVRFLSMEYVEGICLSEVLKQVGPLPPSAVAELGCGLADALSATHAAGIVHRDLKPGNIIIRPSGDACILDFGVAISPTELSRRVTTPKVLLGSRSYISPERWRGGEASVKADVFALAVVLYLAVTGSLPFNGETDAELLEDMMRGRPRPPSAYRPDCAPLDDVLLRALDPDPESRLGSARALEAGLVALCDDEEDEVASMLSGEATNRMESLVSMLLARGRS